MQIEMKHIPHIEKALGIQLFSDVRDYLISDGDSYFKSGRGTGKTIAYCIRLALSEGEPLNMNFPENFSDYGDGSRYYARNFFRHTFLDIRQSLQDYGFPVRGVRNEKAR